MNDISFGKYASILYRYTQMIVNNKLKGYGFGSGQYLFLIAIHKAEGISQKDLTHRLNVDKATTAKALNKLEELDYIERRKDPNDKRFYCIYLSDKGQAFMPTLKAHLDDVTQIVSAGMTEEDIKKTAGYFEQMIDNAIEAVRHLKED